MGNLRTKPTDRIVSKRNVRKSLLQTAESNITKLVSSHHSFKTVTEQHCGSAKNKDMIKEIMS
jgi:hypothetical protein